MYTAYFIIEYKYASFEHPVYVQARIEDGAHYHPLNDYRVMDRADERVQLEMNEYFQERFRESQNCDIEMYLISASEYNDAPDLFLKIVV